MNIKYFFADNKHTKKIYEALRDTKNNKVRAAEERRAFSWHGSFEDRQKGHKKMCMVLAGYKSFLYGATMERLKAYIDPDIDVCIITSGIFSEEIQQLCEKENWSYLSTKENNVAIVQNVAIQLHPGAEWIYKLDEDIFITEGFFSNMMIAYEHADSGFYNPGIMAPLIPVNGYGYVRILQKLGLVENYTKRFEKPQYSTGPERNIEGDPQAAQFMWGGLQSSIPSIDEMAKRFQNEPLEERPCPIRFSIGAVLFARSFWEEMRYFTVHTGNGMGYDEEQICQWCALHARPIMVSENIVVGHLSFGPQNVLMKDYFLTHPEKFSV